MLALAASFYAIRAHRGVFVRRPSVEVPAWAYGIAAPLALLPTIAILPKETSDGIALAGPVFDHAKAAITDDIARLGLPPGNPFFGAAGERLPYYYLWYFGAAQLTRVLGISGWEADAAMTWFTAFTSFDPDDGIGGVAQPPRDRRDPGRRRLDQRSVCGEPIVSAR